MQKAPSYPVPVIQQDRGRVERKTAARAQQAAGARVVLRANGWATLTGTHHLATATSHHSESESGQPGRRSFTQRMPAVGTHPADRPGLSFKFSASLPAPGAPRLPLAMPPSFPTPTGSELRSWELR